MLHEVPNGMATETLRQTALEASRTKPLVDSGTLMANIKSQIKRNRSNAKRAERNKAVRTALKTSTKKARSSVAEGDAEGAVARQREAAKALDKAASRGIVHKRTAARRKSRLAKAANKIGASASTSAE